jgi:hypothetical protein
MYQFISIGGWCGTRIAMDQLNITNEPHNIFDHIRSSSKGIIDCVKSDFANFLPENKSIDTRFKEWRPIIGEHFGFYHSGDLEDSTILNSFKRKIERFTKHCNGIKRCIFVRTCVIPDYELELEDMILLSKEISKKYPLLQFIIVFVIPDQESTVYYRNYTENIFIFCVNDRSYHNENLGKEYRYIFEFISSNNLFETIPPSNQCISIQRPTTRLCLIEDIPAVQYFKTLDSLQK